MDIVLDKTGREATSCRSKCGDNRCLDVLCVVILEEVSFHLDGKS